MNDTITKTLADLNAANARMRRARSEKSIAAAIAAHEIALAAHVAAIAAA